MGLMDRLHEVLAGDLGDLAVLDELAVVVERHEHTERGPRELVAEGVVRGLRGKFGIQITLANTHSRLRET